MTTDHTPPRAPDECIAAAAIKRDAHVYIADYHKRHGDIFRAIGVCPEGVLETQGFWTSRGRFVDREEGARIADAAGQRKPTHIGRAELYTEDMW